MCHFAALVLGVIGWTCLYGTTVVTAAPSPSEKETTTVSMSGTLQAGESFSKEIAKGLVFKISPQRAAHHAPSPGWILSVESKNSDAPAQLQCLPLHGCNNCMIDHWCTVASKSRDNPPSFPMTWTIDLGLGAPDYSAYSDDPTSSRWEPPAMRIPDFPKKGIVEFTLTDLTVHSVVGQHSPKGSEAPLTRMKFNALITMPIAERSEKARANE